MDKMDKEAHQSMASISVHLVYLGPGAPSGPQRSSAVPTCPCVGYWLSAIAHYVSILPMTTAIFQSFNPSARGWGESLAFGTPESVHAAYVPADVPGVLAGAESASRAGKWAAVFVAYEAAPAFDPAFRTHDQVPGLPLAWCAVFSEPEKNAEFRTQNAEQAKKGNAGTGFSDWKPGVGRAEYEAAVRRVRDYIAAGDLYQANYTFPLRSTFRGEPLDAFHALGDAQGAGYSAFLDLGPFKLLSFSPELFFERHGQPQKSGGAILAPPETPGGCHRHGGLSIPRVAEPAGACGVAVTDTPVTPAPSATPGVKRTPWLCHSPEGSGDERTSSPDVWRLVMRPMKGTLPRGRFLAEDLARMRELAACEKNRAENLMILDMLRNDAGRIARPGSVRVPRMFEVERYRTVLQMTSTVEAELGAGVTLPEIFAALFPCGSITGAPKVRTMQIIRELEPFPRGAYTGAIGFLKPGGDAVFKVAIRTVVLDALKSGGGVLPPPKTPGGCHWHGLLSTPKVAESAGGTDQFLTAMPPPPAASATLRLKVNPWLCHSPEGSGDERTSSPDFEAVFGVGGGITWDSTPAGEYEECMLKAAFLKKVAQTFLSARDAGESTGRNACATLENDSAGFDLLESLLLADGHWFLLERHIGRMRESADYFGRPFPEAGIRAALEDVRSAHPVGAWKVRLLLAAAGTPRAEAQPLSGGGAPPTAARAATWQQRPKGAATPPPPDTWRVGVASAPLDSRDIFLFHKTTRRAVYDAARAAHPGADDVILWNERGELTESCFANLVLVLGGELVTPPVACGLLAGTFRAELLAAGVIRERVLRREDLVRAEAVWLVNSVRGWIRAEMNPQITQNLNLNLNRYRYRNRTLPGFEAENGYCPGGRRF